MKKLFVFILVILMIFSTTNLPALAEHIDTEIDMGGSDTPPVIPDEPENPATVTLESGTDAGYIKQSGNNYTAVAYEGNEFLGWF